MNAWVLRPYPYNINRMSQFLKDNVIAIGWPGIGSLYSCEKSCIYQRVSDLYITDFGDKFCRESSNIIWTFKDKMHIGDLVLVVPFKEDGLEIAVGRVDSSYFFDVQYDETTTTDTGYNGFSHRKKVIWLEKRLSRSILPEAVKKNFTRKTLMTLNLEGYNRMVEFLVSRGHNLEERWTMSEYRKHLIETSLKTILDVIQQKTPELTDIFGKMAQEISEIFNETESIHIDSLTSKLSHVASGIEASLIPIDINRPCHKHCLSMAFDKWEAPNGFCEIAKQTMTYWLECLDENSSTIFFTTAWDEVDFLTRFKPQFDAYAKKHSIVVILVTANCFSMPYIG